MAIQTQTEKNSKVYINYLIDYFAQCRTIKLVEQKIKIAKPYCYLDVENIFDTKIEMDSLKKYCDDFYNNVLRFLPIFDIYLLKLRFYKNYDLSLCSKNLYFQCTYSCVQRSLRQYEKLVKKWLSITPTPPM